MTNLFDTGKEIFNGMEAKHSFTEFAAGDDLGPEFVVLSKDQQLAYRDFASGASQAQPIILFPTDRPGQQDFNATGGKILGGILGLDRVRLGPDSPGVESRWKHAGVVKDYEIAGPEQLGKIAKLSVAEGASSPVEVQHFCGRAIAARSLRN